MPEHPLEGLMKTTMDSIRNMVDVNTILGDPVETPDGTVIIPISRVAFGFAAGGSEYELEAPKSQDQSKGQDRSGGQGGSGQGGSDAGTGSAKAFPFGGGTGAGISLQPVAFLVVGSGGIRLLPVDNGGALWNRLIDLAPGVIDQIRTSMGAKSQTARASDVNRSADESIIIP